jgi:pimeloyl-ACP methyl ester carboxylesterase
MRLSGMSPKYAHLLDRTVRYLEAGSGRTCILIHAFPLSADQWLPQLARVPQGWRFVAPDVRGFRGIGQAYQDVGLDQATMATHAADVLQLMSHLDVDTAVIGGVSMGGYVAMAVAKAAPRRLDGLVLADTRATADTDEGRAGRDAMIAKVRADGVSVVADAMLPKLIGETSKREQPDLTDAVRELIMRNTPEAVVSALAAMKARPDSTEVLAQLECPSLVVCGEEDVITPMTDSESMAATLRHSTLVRIPRAGHLSNLEAPLVFNEALGRFLNGLT